jgi:hypothetical protein
MRRPPRPPRRKQKPPLQKRRYATAPEAKLSLVVTLYPFFEFDSIKLTLAFLCFIVQAAEELKKKEAEAAKAKAAEEKAEKDAAAKKDADAKAAAGMSSSTR